MLSGVTSCARTEHWLYSGTAVNIHVQYNYVGSDAKKILLCAPFASVVKDTALLICILGRSVGYFTTLYKKERQFKVEYE